MHAEFKGILSAPCTTFNSQDVNFTFQEPNLNFNS